MKDDGGERIYLYNVDTHYPSSENRTLSVILYGELGTTEFSLFHQLLKKEAQEGTIDYIIRHYVEVTNNNMFNTINF